MEAADTSNVTTTGGPGNVDDTFTEKLRMALTPFQLILGTRNITGIKVQAILNPNNENLDESTDISQQICDTGGGPMAREFQRLLRSYSVLPVSAVVHNTEGDMQPNIKHVVQVVWPELEAYTVEGMFRKVLTTTFLKSFSYTNDVFQSTSLAIPALSLGALGTPPLTVVSTVYSAKRKYNAELFRHRDNTHLAYGLPCQ